MDVVKLIGTIPGFKPVLRTIFKKQYYARIQRQEEKRRESFKNNCMEAVSRFHKCMTENGFNYVAAYGTMLGAIREHGFIKHDLDLDFWMWIEDDTCDLVSALERCGFKPHAHYSIDNDKLGKELTFVYNGCHIDIFFIYPAINVCPYSTLFLKNNGKKSQYYTPLRVELPVARTKRLVPFESINLYVPYNAEELCALRYGPDYMTPNPAWDWRKSTESVVDWEEMISVTTVKHFK